MMTLYEFLFSMQKTYVFSFKVCDETGKELLGDSVNYSDMVNALRYNETDAEQILNALSERTVKSVDFGSDKIFLERGF